MDPDTDDPVVARRLAALERVRSDVAALGADTASAPEVPPEVSARIGAALRAQPTPGGSRWHRAFPWRGTAALAGVLATVTAVGVGSVVLLSELRDAPVTESAPSGGVPLPDDEILALLTRPADLGPLAAPARLSSCLSGLGYPASTSPLGARPLTVDGMQGVLLLLTADSPAQVSAVVVTPNCSALDTGLLARTVVDRR